MKPARQRRTRPYGRDRRYEGEVLRSAARRCACREYGGADGDLIARLQRVVRVLRVRRRADMDRRSGELREQAVAGDVVGVDARLDDVDDAEAMAAGELEVLVDRDRRVDHDCLPGVRDDIRRASEIGVDQLAEEHRNVDPSRSSACDPLLVLMSINLVR